MRARSRSLLRLLVVVAVVEIVLAAITGVGTAEELADGKRSPALVMAAAGALWLVVLLLVVARLVARLRLMGDEIATLTLTGSDWYWESDADLVLTYSSVSVRELLGYEPQELVGRSTFDFLHESDAAEMHTLLHEARTRASGWDTGQTRWRRADGAVVELAGRAIPVLDRHGGVVGFRGSRRATVENGGGVRFADVVRDRVRAAVRDGAIDMALQPIITMATGRLAGVEALARFRDGRGPDVWFGEARQAGCDLELELLAARRALSLIGELDDDAYLSINASPTLIEDPGFDEMLREVDVSRLVIEITEHVAVGRYDTLDVALAPHRQRGLRVAVDDTGAGYASFNHVLQLRPEIIKIDRGVVARTAKDAAARALVTAVVRLAQELDASVVGEGIESRLEFHTLHVLGLTCGQGYYLARPTTDPVAWTSWPAHDWHAAPSAVTA